MSVDKKWELMFKNTIDDIDYLILYVICIAAVFCVLKSSQDALVHSDRFESAMGLIMLANAVMIGFQVSQEEKSAAGAGALGWGVKLPGHSP